MSTKHMESLFKVKVDLKPDVTSAPRNDWFYLNLIHASNCQKNFPNVYKTYGVTVQSKSCLIVLHSIFKVQEFCKSDGPGYLEL